MSEMKPVNKPLRRYLVGFPSKMDDDPKLTHGGVWAPLEQMVAPRYRSKFQFIEKVKVGSVIIHRYQHHVTREALNIDEAGNLYSKAYRLLTIDEARLIMVPNLIQAIADGKI